MRRNPTDLSACFAGRFGGPEDRQEAYRRDRGDQNPELEATCRHDLGKVGSEVDSRIVSEFARRDDEGSGRQSLSTFLPIRQYRE